MSEFDTAMHRLCSDLGPMKILFDLFPFEFKLRLAFWGKGKKTKDVDTLFRLTNSLVLAAKEYLPARIKTVSLKILCRQQQSLLKRRRAKSIVVGSF